MNGENINPHLPSNVTCDHVVPTVLVATNTYSSLSEVSQTSGLLAPRTQTSGHGFDFSACFPSLTLYQNTNSYEVLPVCQSQAKYFTCMSLFNRPSNPLSPEILTIPLKMRVLRLRAERDPVCPITNPGLLTAFHFARMTADKWHMPNL